MEATHQHQESRPHGQHGHHEHDHRQHEDWSSEEYVEHWLERQKDRADERRRQFVMVRSMMPMLPDQEFRYLNLGAGPGNLDEVLLEQFHGAQATLVDGSLAMLAEARNRLERFGDRVEYVQANLVKPEWTGAVSGPFNIAVSTIALHNLEQPRRLRELYAETFRLLGHGGMFLNLDYVRPARPSLRSLADWAAKDPEAGFHGAHGSESLPGTVEEQLVWFREAGFTCADCLWREMTISLLVGLRDHLHMPEGDEYAAADAHAHEAGDAHVHAGH